MNADPEQSRLISYYIPERILGQISQGQKKKFSRVETLTGGILFFDLVKFTPLTKLLSQSGPRGAEKLQEILLNYFNSLLGIIRSYRGCVYQFAGDSVLAAFEKKENETDVQTVQRLLTCSWHMKESAENMAELSFGNDTYRFNTKFSISYGQYYQVILGNNKNFFDAKILGQPIHSAVKGEKFSIQNSIIVDPDIIHLVEQTFEVIHENNFVYVSGSKHLVNSDPDTQLQVSDHPDFLKYCSKFVLPVLIEKIVKNYKGLLADFREITCVFIQLNGLQFTRDVQSSVKMLNSFFESLIEISNIFGGTLIQTDFSDKGNVFLVTFGAPVALEQKELMAVRFSQRIHKMRDIFPFIDSLRIGISTGPSYCGEMGAEFRKSYSVLGESVNFASRIMTLSDDKCTYVDAGTEKKIRDFFNTEIVENVVIKGLKETVNLFRIISKEKNELNKSIKTNRFFGRQKEIKIFEDSLKQLQNNPPSMILVGEAGVGKSRLVREFSGVIENNKLALIISNCYSYEKFTPFFPWKTIFYYIFGISETDSEKVSLLKIREYMESVEGVRLEWVPVFLQILGFNAIEDSFTSDLEPRQKNDRISQITYNLLLKKSDKNPFFIIIEDIHWMDDVSRGLFKYILSRPLKNTMMLLVSRPDKILTDFENFEFVKILKLDELNSSDAREYLKDKLHMESEDESVENEILARAHGNPFFIESIVYSLREQNYLIPTENGKFKLAGSINNIEIPNTLQDVLLSRIDRLKENDLLTLKTASVVGRIFSVDLLRELSPEQIRTNLDESLVNLQDNNFTLPENPEALSYIFKHVLIRDVVYNSIISSTRRDLHNKLAYLLELKNQENMGITVDTLAYHFLNGGELAKALEYSLMAAETALARYGNLDAAYYFEKVLEIFNDLNVSESNDQYQHVQEKLAGAYGAGGLPNKAIELFEKCLPYRKTDLEKSDVYIGLGKVYSDMGDSLKAIQAFEKGLVFSGGKVPQTKLGVYLSIAKSMFQHEINEKLPFTVINASKNSNRWRKLKKQSQILYNLDKIYYFEDVEKLAWSNFNNVIIADKLDDPALIANAYANYGLLLTGLGMFNRAESNFKKSFKYADISGNAVIRAVSEHRYGMRGMYTNTPREWGQNMSKALATFEEVSDLWEMYISFAAVALSNYFASDFRQTITHYSKLLSVAEKNHAKRYIIWSKPVIFLCRYLLGEIDATTVRKEIIEYVIPLCKEVKDLSSLCSDYHDLTLVSIREHDLTNLYQDVMENFNHISQYTVFIPDSSIAYASAAEGSVILLQNHFGDSKVLHKIVRKSLKKLLKWGKTFSYVRGPALRVQAMYQDFLGSKNKARALFLKSIEVHLKTENHWETGLAYFEAARALPDKRLDFLDHAEFIFKKYRIEIELKRLRNYRNTIIR